MNNMYVQEIVAQEQWDSFINTHAYTTFMQSWAWGAFEESCGHHAIRWGVFENAELVATIQGILIKSKRGTFLYVPHGPILQSSIAQQMHIDETGEQSEERLTAILKVIHETMIGYAQKHGCSFLRLNSSLPKKKWLEQILGRIGYRKAPIYLTSENAAILNLKGKTPDDLLKHMRKTTRYLIQKAVREGVTTTVDTTGNSLTDFMRLYQATTARERFVGFSEEYIRKEFEAFNQSGDAAIITSYHNSEPLASALILFTKKAAFYHQGASNHPKVPAPYALQWEGIQLALKRECEYYNFWGTYIPNRTPQGWKGLSLFKTGFGTETWEYIPTHDYVIHPAYYLTFLYEQILRHKRGV